MACPPVEILNYFLPVSGAFGKQRVSKSTFLTHEGWSPPSENGRELQRTVWIHFTISEKELQTQFTWLNSESKKEYEVKPGLFFGNTHDGSDGVYLRTERTTIQGQVSSGTPHTKIWFETPPELVTADLWKSHSEWFEDHEL